MRHNLLSYVLGAVTSDAVEAVVAAMLMAIVLYSADEKSQLCHVR